MILSPNLTPKMFASKPYVSQYGYVEFWRKKPPLPKGRGTTEGGGGIKKGFVKTIPQSATLTAPFTQGSL